MRCYEVETQIRDGKVTASVLRKRHGSISLFDGSVIVEVAAPSKREAISKAIEIREKMCGRKTPNNGDQE